MTGGKAVTALVLHMQCSAGAESIPGCGSGIDSLLPVSSGNPCLLWVP